MHAGVVLAGGRSTRFGDADKAVADLAGTPMLRRVADRLAGTVDALVVNCRREQTAAIREAMAGYSLPVSYAEDPEPDLGPVAGIQAGLRVVDAEYAAVVACDMPFVEPDLVSYLFERAHGHDAAVPRLDDGWLQVTQAVYRARAMADACEAALAGDDRRVVAPLDALDYVVVHETAVREHGSPGSFRNLNSREAFEAAAEQLP